MNFKIKNNFFKKDEFNKMKYIITHPNFNWFLQTSVVYKEDCIFFSHTFFNDDGICSPFYKDIVIPFIDKLKIKKLLRSKLNLYPKTHKQIIHGFHTDSRDKHNVVLFYFNTNNGQTLFKNKKINSVENRIVLFNSDEMHSSTNTTNCKSRIVINFNYF